MGPTGGRIFEIAEISVVTPAGFGAALLGVEGGEISMTTGGDYWMTADKRVGGRGLEVVAERHQLAALPLARDLAHSKLRITDGLKRAQAVKG
jgi:hypothetical protein